MKQLSLTQTTKAAVGRRLSFGRKERERVKRIGRESIGGRKKKSFGE
jgi:hypothetical protein